MAIQYVVTEEELQSLIDSLRLENYQIKEKDGNASSYDMEKATPDEIHRRFHFVAVRWAQSIGYKGHR